MTPRPSGASIEALKCARNVRHVPLPRWPSIQATPPKGVGRSLVANEARPEAIAQSIHALTMAAKDVLQRPPGARARRAGQCGVLRGPEGCDEH